MILRQQTGRIVAWTIWQLPDGSVTHMKHLGDDPYCLKQNGGGDPLDSPEPGAVFLGGEGGFPEVDTADGWLYEGDCVEMERDGVMQLCVATGDDPDFEAHAKQYELPEPMSIKDLPLSVLKHPDFDSALAAALADLFVGVKVDCSDKLDPKLWFSRVTGVHAVSSGNRIWLDKYDLKALPDLQPATPVLSAVPFDTFEPNHFSVTFDATAAVSGSATTSVTVSLTMSSSANGYMAGTASFGRATSQTLSSAKWNTTETMTSRLVADTVTVPRRGEYSDLVAPTSGAHSVVFTFSANTNSVCGVQSATGVNQTSPRETVGTPTTGTGFAPSYTIASSVGNLVFTVFTVVGSGTSTDTVDVTWVSDWSQTSNSATLSAGAHIAGAASVTRTDVVNLSLEYALLGVSIAAVASGWGPLLGLKNNRLVVEV